MNILSDAEREIVQSLPQPFGFYRVLSGTSYLHFGYWPAEQPNLGLNEAQTIASEKIFSHLPPPPARILDIGCGLGATAGALLKRGYEVVAIAPADELIASARHHYAGATYISCGFLDEQPLLSPPNTYDAILSQESLQYFPDIEAVFKKIKSLLAPTGRFLLCDEVSYDAVTHKDSAVHEAKDIEKYLAAQGFYHSHHEYWGTNVTPTCVHAVEGFQQKKSLLIELFGEQCAGTVDHFLAGWQQQLDWYTKGIFGYEFWVLHASDITLKSYQEGDEQVILKAFNTTFNTQRDLKHWQWKYLNNPYGKTWIAAAWDKEQVIAQYAGYPVQLYVQKQVHLSCQAADAFTVPAYRKIGYGTTGLMSRCFYFYERQHCELQTIFGYGFNVNKIQKLGKLFWQHTVPAPVYQQKLSGDALTKCRSLSTWRAELTGYRVVRMPNAGDWATHLFEKVKDEYGWLLVRDKTYLNWRYEQHPDFKHDFFVVYHWNQPIGWIVGRVHEQQWLWGDALFMPSRADIALSLVLKKLLTTYPQIAEIESWFAEVPQWWNLLLAKQGFNKQRQHQNLDLVVRFYLQKIPPETLAQNFYFTWGDSDLF